MKKCTDHQIEYGQESSDFQKNMLKMRCVNCGYKSYSLLKPNELHLVIKSGVDSSE